MMMQINSSILFIHKPLPLCLRVIPVSLSQTTTVWGQAAFHQATCGIHSSWVTSWLLVTQM